MAGSGSQETIQPCADFHCHSQIRQGVMLEKHAAGHGHQTVTGKIDLIITVRIRNGEVSVRDSLSGNKRENLTVI